MRRIVILIIFLHSSFLAIYSQSVSLFFESMPDSILPLLTAKNRHDMLDFYGNKMDAKVRNRFEDYVQLDTLTDSYLHLTLSKASTAEMKLLHANDSSLIIAFVQTVSAPARDSRIAFFNSQWQRLQWLQLPLTVTSDFFSSAPDSVSHEMNFAQRSVDDMRLVEIYVSPSEPVFTLRLSTDVLADDEKRLARRYVRDVSYRWTGLNFERLQ